MLKDKSNIIRITILALILLILAVRGITSCYNEQSRYNDLVEAGHYELYFTYIARDREYHLFLLMHESPKDTESLKTYAASIIEEKHLITDLRSRETYRKFGDHPITIHFMQPNEEIPYGWEKSELNISMNFDQSAFYRATVLTVEIPIGVMTAANCSYNIYEH